MKKISLWIETSRGPQHVKYNTIFALLYKFRNRKYSKWMPTTVFRNKYNDKIVVPGVKYVVSFVDGEGEMQTVFIHKAGMMSSAIFGNNGLPREVIENEESLREYFDSEFGKRGIIYVLKTFNGPIV